MELTSTTFHNNYFTQHVCSSTSFATYHYSPQIPASAISRRAGDQKLIIDLVWPKLLKHKPLEITLQCSIDMQDPTAKNNNTCSQPKPPEITLKF